MSKFVLQVTSQIEVIGSRGHCQLSGWVTESVCLFILLCLGENSLPSSQTAESFMYVHTVSLNVSIVLSTHFQKDLKNPTVNFSLKLLLKFFTSAGFI